MEGRGLFGETTGVSPFSMCVLEASFFYQAWQQASLPAEPSCYLPPTSLLKYFPSGLISFSHQRAKVVACDFSIQKAKAGRP